MHPTAHPALSDPRTTTLIEQKVAAVRQSWGLSPGDADDVRQELYRDLLERLPRHDPTKARIALFVEACVHRKIYNLVRRLLAAKRRPACDSVERLAEAMATTGTPVDTAAADRAGRQERRLRDLRLDLAAVMPGLSSEERDLMQALMSESVTDIARRTGRTRKMVYRIVASLRRKLARAGLGAYVAIGGAPGRGRG